MQKVLSLQINVVRKDGYWAILDKDLFVVGSLSDLAVECALQDRIAGQDDVDDREWAVWARVQPSKLARPKQDSWSKKIDCWLSSINKRHASAQRVKPVYVSASWYECIWRMHSSINSKAYRRERINSDPWRLWCESSGSNLAKRTKEKANSNGLRTEEIA